MASTAVISASRQISRRDWVSEGWCTSLLVHALVLYAALFFTKQIQLRPPEPFRWEISLVSSTEGESPMASLEDKGAAYVDTSVEAPPVITSASRGSNTPAPEDRPPNIKESAKAGNSVRERAPDAIMSTADKLFEVVGPDGSISFTNVPSDSRSREKHFSQGLLSTVDSTSAFKTNTKGLSPRPPSLPAKSDTAWVWQTILRRLVIESNTACYPVSSVEGKVVLRLLIDEHGYMSNFEVVTTSGYGDLDQNIFDIIRHVNPVTLPRPLGQPSMWLQFPMTYTPRSPRPTGCARING